MSTPKGPSGGAGGTSKPLLGLDDSDVDAWDSMFDAMHSGPEPSAQPPATATPTPQPDDEWDAGEGATVAAVMPPEFARAQSEGFDDFLPPAAPAAPAAVV
ncbi:MAG: hypothetical protein KIT31_43005, partial [Deltaproteobacteria bacterium]|nr:hypothetical protein [Deltaproteobacteria bacterium]